jgi:hypothetical protein
MSLLATSGRHHRKACIPYSGDFMRSDLGGGTGGVGVVTGVAVGGIGVAVAGIGVCVGGMGVAVGGTGVSVGGTPVSVGETTASVGAGEIVAEPGVTTCATRVKVGRAVRVAVAGGAARRLRNSSETKPATPTSTSVRAIKNGVLLPPPGEREPN